MHDDWWDPIEHARQDALASERLREEEQYASNPNEGANYIYPVVPEAHHLFPREMEDWFGGPGRGIKVDDWCVKLERDMHHDLHRWWNDEWKDFRDANPNASKADVENKLYDMMDRSGILEKHIEEGLPIHPYREFRPHFERE